MSEPPVIPPSAPPLAEHRTKFESALSEVETAKDTLQKVALELPNPPTVEVVVNGRKKRELASAIGAEPTDDERKLGAAERSIERLGEVAEDLRDAGGGSGPPPWPLD